MDLDSNLGKLGLSNQESLVYITSLKLGVAKASHIAQKAGLGRGGVYYVLKLLKEKGFVSEVIRSGVQYYNAISPERILDIIDEERDRKNNIAKELVPELKNIQKTSISRPVIEVYEGPEGFKSIFSKLLERPKQEFRCYLSLKALDYLPHFHEQFRIRRIERKIKIRTITEKSPDMENIKKLDKKELRETRYYEKILKGNEIIHYILEDSIVIVKANKTEQLAIYIQDKNLSELHKNIFEDLWLRSIR